MSNCKEIVEELEAKISQYEEMLEALTTTPRDIGKIISKSHMIGEKKFYRVLMSEGKERVLHSTIDCENDSEVLVLNNVITAKLPNLLNRIIPENKISLAHWEEIGGLKSQIKDIREAVELPIKNSKVLKEFGMSPVAGILLYGEPGCGKTLIAKAIAHTVLEEKSVSHEAFIHLKAGDILDKYVGESEKIISSVFKKARDYMVQTKKRSIIFIDEAEALLSDRRSGRNFSVVPSFLAEMDGIYVDKPLVILATNLESQLDPAVVREGRIDLKIHIKRPDALDFKDIVKIHLKKSPCKDEIDELASNASELVFNSRLQKSVSGAMASAMAKFAIQKAIVRNIEDKSQKGITHQDIESAVEILIAQN